MYEHRQPLRLSEKVDLSGLGLSAAVQAQLDSIYAHKGRRTIRFFPKKYDLAKQKLEGRVLYWFLAEELMRSFKRGSEVLALAQRQWEDFQQSNPYPEYTEAVQEVDSQGLIVERLSGLSDTDAIAAMIEKSL